MRVKFYNLTQDWAEVYRHTGIRLSWRPRITVENGVIVAVRFGMWMITSGSTSSAESNKPKLGRTDKTDTSEGGRRT